MKNQITREQEKLIEKELMKRGYSPESAKTQVSYLIRGIRDVRIGDETIFVCQELKIKLV